jgi:hypothetical protein
MGDHNVAALFVRADSVYKRMPGVDCWDAERDARLYAGPWPVVAHPPCRLWGMMKHYSNADPAEKQLAIYAVEQVRRFGGVLEHPAHSRLWLESGLGGPGSGVDEFGGQTISLNQFAWGHKALKPTWVYVVGCTVVPTMAVEVGSPKYCIARCTQRKHLKHVTHAEREMPPPPFAAWLVEIARRCVPQVLAHEVLSAVPTPI